MSKYPEIDAVLAGESEGCIVCADCLEVMAEMPDGCVDAVVTDPPYGIGFAGQPTKWQRRAGQAAEGWDDQTVDLPDILRLGEAVAVWGGNYYQLPPSRGWLVWYKADAPPSMSCIELAWTNRDQLTKMCNHTISATNAERVGHPTQKPLGVILWTLREIGASDVGVVLDPYCGSGTTCVAAKQTGRRYIGIEINERYCEIARKRLRDTPKPLFTEHATADAPKTGLFE